jgi:cytochrome c oxidase cbb3-type subunit III
MKHLLLLAPLLATSACGVGDVPPGELAARTRHIAPDKVLDFKLLYASNCAGCHGENGKGGAAIGLGDPVYLAIADDTAIRRATAEGVRGTSMPAFAQSSGGSLTDGQIDAIVHGIRSSWAKPDALQGAVPPPYTAAQPGDPHRGAAAYGTFCSSCHGPDGRGGTKASSIVDSAFLTLVSDQSLRTTTIAGRPDLGSPDWRNDVPGNPMTPQDVSDIVAWLSAQRPGIAGQPYSSAVQPQGGQQ